ncbi:MAG: hypothetical protein HWE26_17695 [Alteromonadaceae bacterium]|nr:hypothetical protein [Alteromonadaceae bacterium]
MATISSGNSVSVSAAPSTKIDVTLSGAAVVKSVVAEPPQKSMHQRAADALEEVGMAYHKLVKADRHRVKDDRRYVDRLSNSKLKEAAFAFDKLQKIDECSEHLRHTIFDETFLPQWLANFSQDKGEQYVALTVLKDSLIAHPGLASVTQQLDRLLSPLKASKEVDAALAGYATIAWGAEQGIPPTLLQTGTEQYGQFTGLYQAWHSLVNQFGEHALVAGPHHIYQALAAQYHNGGQAIDVNELRSILEKMSVLKSLLGLFDQCKEVVSVCMPTAFHDTTGDEQSQSLLKQVLGLVTKPWVQKMDITAIARELNITSSAGANALGVSLKRLINMVSPQWFNDSNNQQQCLEVMTEFLDAQARMEQAYG